MSAIRRSGRTGEEKAGAQKRLARKVLMVVDNQGSLVRIGMMR